MSYDLYLRDPVTRERLQVPGHLMHGGNIPCEPIGGRLVPTTTTEAYINITYNYSGYYHEAFPGVSDKPEEQAQYEKDCEAFGIHDKQGGIRSLNGLSGAQAVPLLQEMIRRIERKYQDIEGWIDTEREKVWYESRKDRRVTRDPTEMFIELLHLKRDGLSDEDAAKYLDKRWEKHEGRELVSEGDTRDYWKPTAANAIRPLHQLIALSRMRPDGVWSEES
jgi:hypothetical protein